MATNISGSTVTCDTIILTHIQLSHKASNVIVLEVQWKHLLRKPTLLKHMETFPALKNSKCGELDHCVGVKRVFLFNISMTNKSKLT